MKSKKSLGDRLYIGLSYAVTIFVLIITLYPFVYVLSMSFSSPNNVITQSVWLLPKGFSVSSYKVIFGDKAVWRSYYNTIWYVVVGTSINVVMTILAAYPLSKTKFFLKNYIMGFIAFTMFFSGGLIPSFININELGLFNTRWTIVLPSAVSAWYIIIARTFFKSLPESLFESATIDGATESQILIRIALPLSAPIISVLVLFYAIARWNEYFSALLYLTNKDLQPLQLYLKRVLLENSLEYRMDNISFDPTNISSIGISEQIKYSLIIVATLPVICVYPFLQKYFVKGMMIGAIKG